jgi:hypothetical protein
MHAPIYFVGTCSKSHTHSSSARSVLRKAEDLAMRRVDAKICNRRNPLNLETLGNTA